MSGWRIDLEDFASLNALPGESDVLAMRGAYEEVPFDPREVMKVENQGGQGACQGHAISSCVEWCHCLETGESRLQLSRAMGYYETQRIDGISGDRGSTISGGVELATRYGICREQVWPYPSRYNPKRPRPIEEIHADAERFKIGQSRRLQTYDGVRTFLGSGQGGITIGISWGQEMSKPVVERFSGRGGGGHAIGLFSLSDRKDASDRPYVWMMNSWGERFGNGGWSEWSPTAIEQMMRHRYTVAIGVSDMPNVEPRKLAFNEIREGFVV